MLFLLLSFAANPALAQPREAARQPDVAIVLSEKAGSYEEFDSVLGVLLASKGVSHVVTDAAGEIPAAGLVVAVGTKAATAVAASDAPAVLNVLITKASHSKLLHDFPRRAGSHTYAALYLDQPMDRQARLIAAILPQKHTVGLLYSTPPRELAQLGDKLGEYGLTLRSRQVDSLAALPDALQDVLGRSEVLLALPDAAIYNDSTIRNILLATYRMGVPLVGFSQGYVKAGALCAVFSTPAQLAEQAAALIMQFREVHALPATQYPQQFEVTVNEQVARSLGLNVKTAPVLHDEIDRESKEAFHEAVRH